MGDGLCGAVRVRVAGRTACAHTPVTRPMQAAVEAPRGLDAAPWEADDRLRGSAFYLLKLWLGVQRCLCSDLWGRSFYGERTAAPAISIESAEISTEPSGLAASAGQIFTAW